MNIDNLISAIIYIIVFYILFFIGKKVHDLIHREYKLIEELVEKDNPALALSVAGYYFGLVLCLGGTLVGPSNGIEEDILDLCIYGILSIILLNISWFVCDKLVLYKFRVNDELIRDRNQGTGAIACAVSIASGLVIYGSVAGEGGNIWTAAGFWAMGQVVLLVAALVYNVMTPYSIHDEVEKDNVAAGVSFAGALIAMGIIVGLAAEGEFSSWNEIIYDYLLIVVSGLVLLPIIRMLTDRVLLPTVKLTDEIVNQEIPNLGAAYIEAFSYIAAAFVIYWCV